MPLKNILSFYLIIFASLMKGQPCIAQKIDLKDVIKIECVVNRGALRRSVGRVEVLFENNTEQLSNILLSGLWER
ncbi:hypothetical protein HK413_13375 [Mucilaginibacter sp. S1162]|uniref:Uncharacterized protein n=1 Tax=Mucilaginibacter humi TaxID=2732510 RepID=A0ABX1W3J5_9SPHI|nr:hypothetical protein [Mucilaginibacter humi]NNU34797.1 hypothetical protein [Mucilaginibacter humi]